MSGDGQASHATHLRYQYEALQNPTSQIRILALQPSREMAAELCGHLVIRPINGYRTRYEALSYTWGTDQSSEALLLGQSSLPLPLGLNLRNGLRQLRHSRRTRYLWIDAICIDQQHNEEKTAQIAIMGQIYAKARRTVIWLGKESPVEDGKIAIAFFSRLGKTLWYRHKFADLHLQYQMITSSLKHFFSSCFGSGRRSNMITNTMREVREDYWPGKYSLVDDEYAAILNSLGQQNFETAILPFLQRPWFRRRWIIQEVCLARKAILLCGPHALPWVAFERGLSSDHHNKIWQGSHLAAETLGSAAGIIAESKGRQMTLIDCVRQLFFLLSLLNDFQCQDPRDAIAALLGLWTPFSSHKMIDYNLSIESNYIIFATQAIDLGCILDVFYAVITRPRKGTYVLPSWVPDWSMPSLMWLSRPSWDNLFTPSFTLSKGPPGSVPTLCTLGLVLDTVTRVPSEEAYRESRESTFFTALGGNGRAANLIGDQVDRSFNNTPEGISSIPDFPHLVQVGDIICSFIIDKRFMNETDPTKDYVLQGVFALRDAEDSNSTERKCRLVSVVKLFRPGNNNVSFVRQAFKDDALNVEILLV